nr:hypothetical protein CFP56_37092 [Quercus suber]
MCFGLNVGRDVLMPWTCAMFQSVFYWIGQLRSEAERKRAAEDRVGLYFMCPEEAEEYGHSLIGGSQVEICNCKDERRIIGSTTPAEGRP